ncbi:hypothetical protein KAR91_05320 [Candidatus Pacearchaeota archaeon]|nr:hypothetical protein [Candidatus Pacearchaeota archaeon]
MSTESESSSVNCILCGQAIELGERSYAIFTGKHEKIIPSVSNDQFDFYNADGDLGLACGCLLRAAERHAEGLPVFDDDCTVTDYVKCVTDTNIPLRERIDYAVNKQTKNTYTKEV